MKVRAKPVNSLDRWFLTSRDEPRGQCVTLDGIAGYADRMGSAERKDCRGWFSCVVRANRAGAEEKRAKAEKWLKRRHVATSGPRLGSGGRLMAHNKLGQVSGREVGRESREGRIEA